MIKSIKAILAQDKEKFKVPRKVQDLIPIKNIWPDGIFKVGNKFSKSFRFSDINYLVASREDKESMFLTYSELLNSLDSGATTKITINNHRLNRSDFEESILMPMKQDGLDEYRKEYNDMLLDKATGANGIMQEKYITITVAKKDIEEARAYFARIGADLTAHFANLGSKCVPLNAVERLRILHDFYRPGDEAAFSFDMNRKARLAHDFRDYICPDSVERTADHIKLGEKYARVLFLKDYASYIKDSMFSELTELNRNLMLSIDVIPIPTDDAVREVERLLLGVETNITGWQRRQNQNNNFSAVVPYDMELQRKESKEFLDDLTTRDQRMMFAVVTMVITADTKEQLDLDTETVLSTARKHMCQMATLKYQQTDGLNTVLPIGTRKINAFRTLTTESLAVLMPFKVQEIMDKGGIYFGENAISHNLIMCNKANLLNQSAFLLGVPGSGKSFSAKELITFLILNTNDDIMICDPEGEYAPLIEAMGDLGSVIRVSAGGRDRLNAMYMVDGYGENNPIVVKSEFIMSLIEQIDKKGVGPQHKSIIDRCITNVYRNAADAGTIPTLCTLRDMLLEQPEPEAKQIALSLELYTTGSLDIFGKQSNVDLDKRVVVFDIHGLGSQLKPTGLLVITDTMLNRVTLNWKKGKRTHVFIDEFHVVFENEFSAQFFNSAWRQFRKRNAYPTAITQNVEYLLDSVQASTMLSNSEFVVMLNQAASDRGQLAKLLNISNEQMSYITNADAGCGLIKYGSALVPFINRFPQNTKLYQLKDAYLNKGNMLRKRLIKYLSENKNTCFDVLYKGQKRQMIEVLRGRYNRDMTFKDTIDLAASLCFDEYFCTKYPDFPVMKTKITRRNMADCARAAFDHFAGRKTQQSTLMLQSFGVLDGDKIRPEGSKYAAYYIEQLRKLPPQGVLNYSDIFQSRFMEMYIDKRFKIEFIFTPIIFLSMVYGGYAVITTKDGKTITASNLDQIPKTSVMDLYEFKYLSRPAQISMAELKKLFEVLDINPALLDNPNDREKGVAQLLSKAQEMANSSVLAANKLSNGFDLWGEPLANAAEVAMLQRACTAVRDEFSNYQAKFNTPAKLNNFSLSMDQVDALAEQISLMMKIPQFMDFKSDCADIVSYIANIEYIDLGEAFKAELDAAKAEFRSIRDSIMDGVSGETAAQKVDAILSKIKAKYITRRFLIRPSCDIFCITQILMISF